jgi:hypothetical protein
MHCRSNSHSLKMLPRRGPRGQERREIQPIEELFKGMYRGV